MKLNKINTLRQFSIVGTMVKTWEQINRKWEQVNKNVGVIIMNSKIVELNITKSCREDLNRNDFIKSLGLDVDNLPGSMLEEFLYLDMSSREIDKDNIKQRTVYLKNIVGTTHHDYGNLPLIQAFYLLKRGSSYCEYLKKRTPKVYHIQLHKSIKEQWTPEVPIGFVKIGSNYYIHGNGNHRTIIYKIMCLAELGKAKNRAERDKINKKYYIKANVYEIKK